jgi:hypothetical protein
LIDFAQSAEDEMDVVAKYYRVPSLSWRNMMHAALSGE